MLRQGPVPVALHAASEPFLVALLIAAPFIFAFSNQSAPTAISIIAGLVILVVAMSTRWKLSLVKVIPVEVHALLDLGLGAFLIASPFIFGFSDESEPTAFFIVFGIVEILATLGTAWRGDVAAATTARR
ncbi:MAG: hypothetical protein M3417_13100 [Actinomycetota bacterium]|nr:hypothetical protein [Actinomycetota bacterium]